MTWLQVIDDAVKIGLGALIGGGWVYLQTKASGRRETEKERDDRTFSIIKDIASDIDSFHRQFMSYVRLVEVRGDLDKLSDKRLVRRAESNITNRKLEGEEEFRKRRMTAMDKTDKLSMARTKVSLLGVKATEQALSYYSQSAEEFWQDGGEDGRLTVEQFERLYPRILRTRDEFFDHLRQALP